MNQLALPSRIAVEVRQSPVKAIVLGSLVVVAACVWGPKFFRTTAPSAPAATIGESATDVAGTTGASNAVDFTQRDPSAIRAEFIQISEDARALRRIAESRPSSAIEVDPFLPLPGPIEEPQAAAPQNEPEAVAASQGELEQVRARSLVLAGVIVFGRGRAAILDGKVVRPGDRVAGFEVTAVEARRVELRGESGSYVLSMDDRSPPSSGSAEGPARKENHP